MAEMQNWLLAIRADLGHQSWPLELTMRAIPPGLPLGQLGAIGQG